MDGYWRMKLPIVREDYPVDCIKKQKKLPFDLYKVEAIGETSGLVTLKVKGQSVVHESSGLQDSGHMLKDGKSIYNTTLSMSDLSTGVNSLLDTVFDSDFTDLSVMDLESELKERTQAFELQSVTFQEKIKELENKLESERGNKGYVLLQQKIEELEKKLRTKDLTVYTEPSCSSEKQKRTPVRKAYSTAETPSGIDNLRLRSLNSISRPSSQGSVLLKGPDSIRELRRKQDLQSKGIENNFLLSAPSVEKKVLPTDSSKARRLDPSIAFARITRSRKAVSSAQRPFPSNRINREQVMGVKEGDNGTRVWSR